MNVMEWLTGLGAQISQTPVIEWVAVIFGLIQVLLARNNNIWNYAAGIISTALSIYVLHNAMLYAESWLNAYYLVMSIYGFVHWMGNRQHRELPITKANPGDWLITAMIVVIGFCILYYVLSEHTGSDVPAMDAWVSATAWAGMWLLARRKVENWILLNISNIFAIPLQIYKGIPLYAVLTLVLFIVAIFGYLKWRKIYFMQHAKA